jgi:hypothetical protein
MCVPQSVQNPFLQNLQIDYNDFPWKNGTENGTEKWPELTTNLRIYNEKEFVIDFRT